MKKIAEQVWSKLAEEDDKFVFLTGDLGFNALESLKKSLGNRFINAGVSEQNMISVASGLASTGLKPWVYSIAPFCYARPFEQIRNDICLHHLPVHLVGNGGGFSYGVMGSTHHATEDYGILLTLRNMKIFIPAFIEDINPMIRKIALSSNPTYLRLGHNENPPMLTIKEDEYHPVRKILDGNCGLLVVLGPIIGPFLSFYSAIEEDRRPEIWCISELPLSWPDIPDTFLSSLERQKKLYVVEEHVEQGSFASHLTYLFALKNISFPKTFHHLCVRHPCGKKNEEAKKSGSQLFYRLEYGLTPEALEMLLLSQ